MYIILKYHIYPMPEGTQPIRTQQSYCVLCSLCLKESSQSGLYKAAAYCVYFTTKILIHITASSFPAKGLLCRLVGLQREAPPKL